MCSAGLLKPQARRFRVSGLRLSAKGFGLFFGVQGVKFWGAGSVVPKVKPKESPSPKP